MLSPKIFLSLLLVAFIWGFNPFANKLLLSYGTSHTFMFIRYLLTGLTILSYLLYKRKIKLPTLKNFFIFSILGILAVPITMYLCIEGLQYSTVTNAALINSISPIIISVSAFIIFRESLYPLQWFGIVMVTFSTTYLVSNGNIGELFSMTYNKGDLLFLLAQLSWAAYTLASSKLLKKIHILDLSMWVALTGGFASLIMALFTDTLAMPILNLNSILLLSFSIWINSALAILLWNFGVQHAGSQISSIFINLSTVIGVLLGVFLLNEEFNQYVLIGTLGIILGVIILTQYKYILWLYHKSLFWNKDV